MAETVAVVPIGTTDAGLLGWLAGRLPVVLGLRAEVLPVEPLPADGYDPGRRQYVGEAILDTLNALDLPDADRVLGIVDADCYIPRLNYVFGVAQVQGRLAFVALARLRPSFYGQPDNQALFFERVLKEVVHELGHTYGLAHCPDPHCVMHYSNTLADTDFKGKEFCPRCQAALPSIPVG